MTYFLDFDRTVFDFEKFVVHLAQMPGLVSVREEMLKVYANHQGENAEEEERRRRLRVALDTLYAEGAFSFSEGALADFVFPDALSFLKEKGSSTVIVTTGGIDLGYQKGKVAASGVQQLVLECVFVQRGNPKGPFVEALTKKYPAPYCFVDDLAPELVSVSTYVPGISAYEIRRDGKAGSGVYPVIRSLAELP